MRGEGERVGEVAEVGRGAVGGTGNATVKEYALEATRRNIICVSLKFLAKKCELEQQAHLS